MKKKAHTMMNERSSEFWKQMLHILNSHLQYDRKPGTPSLGEVADMSDVKMVTLYKILEGYSPVRVEAFPRFYRACGKPYALLTCLVRACEPSAAIIFSPRRDRINGSMNDEIEELTVRLGQFVEKKRVYLKDNHVDMSEGDSLAGIIAVMMDQLHGLLEEIGAATGKKETTCR